MIINTQSYLSDILNSYNNNVANIYRQYCIDYRRMSIFNNGNKIKTITHIIKNFRSQCIINDITFNMSDILLSLCTQAAHAHAFLVIKQMFENMSNCALCSDRTSFDIKNNLICINSYFLLKNINTSKIINKVHAQLRLGFDQSINEKGILIIEIK